jgi:hypothetical protein
VAYWIDDLDRARWVGPWDSLDEAIEQCQTWFPKSTVRWLPDE